MSLRRSELGVALVGHGLWAAPHVEAVRRTGLADVVAIVGRDPARVAAAASRLGVAQGSVNYAQVLDDPRVHVVHVCTPNESHARLAHLALAAGKHVAVEKPLATSATEAMGVATAADAARLHGMTVFTYRGLATMRRARSLVGDGALGQLRTVAGHYLQDWLATSPTNWRLDPAIGGPSAAVADIGVHCFDATEYISGQHVESVLADLARNGRRVTGAEDTGGVLLEFANDATGIMLVSQTFTGRQNTLRIELAGDRGSLRWELGPNGVELEALGTAPAEPDAEPSQTVADGLSELFRSFYQVILQRPEPAHSSGVDYPTLWDGYRACLFVDAVLASARARAWRSLEARPSDGVPRAAPA